MQTSKALRFGMAFRETWDLHWVPFCVLRFASILDKSVNLIALQSRILPPRLAFAIRQAFEMFERASIYSAIVCVSTFKRSEIFKFTYKYYYYYFPLSNSIHNLQFRSDIIILHESIIAASLHCLAFWWVRDTLCFPPPPLSVVQHNIFTIHFWRVIRWWLRFATGHRKAWKYDCRLCESGCAGR